MIPFRSRYGSPNSSSNTLLVIRLILAYIPRPISSLVCGTSLEVIVYSVPRSAFRIEICKSLWRGISWVAGVIPRTCRAVGSLHRPIGCACYEYVCPCDIVIPCIALENRPLLPIWRRRFPLLPRYTTVCRRTPEPVRPKHFL